MLPDSAMRPREEEEDGITLRAFSLEDFPLNKFSSIWEEWMEFDTYLQAGSCLLGERFRRLLLFILFFFTFAVLLKPSFHSDLAVYLQTAAAYKLCICTGSVLPLPY